MNLDHLDHLFALRVFPDLDSIGFVYRHSTPPDFDPEGVPDEGAGSVDDAARAAVVYLRHYRKTKRPESLQRGRLLLRFLIYMQADNGFFYNYMREDGSRNDTTLYSRPRPGLWSWRAMWSMGQALKVLPGNDPLYSTLDSCRRQAVSAALSSRRETNATTTFGGLTLPAWLPRENDARQAAQLILALGPYYEATGSATAKSYLEDLAEGILMMQVDNQGRYPTGAFLSYRNIWRAEHNLQSFALLRAGAWLDQPGLTRMALREVDIYYPQLEQKGYASEWFFEKNALDTFDVVEERRLPLYPADFRPTIWSCMEAYEITGDTTYLGQARSVTNWFFGGNAAGAYIYDPRSGRAYEGLDERGRLIENASAAATVEALLTMQVMEGF